MKIEFKKLYMNGKDMIVGVENYISRIKIASDLLTLSAHSSQHQQNNQPTSTIKPDETKQVKVYVAELD